MTAFHFDRVLESHGIALRRARTRVLQINVGKKCNQTCGHCHVNAGPSRREEMTRATVEHILKWLAQTEIGVVDITGGAPELNPHFRFLVEQVRHMSTHAAPRRVMDRCNLTILFERGQEDLAEFLASNEVEIVASLPCYGPENVDAQRGLGVFDRSILGLQKLNELGYGRDARLPLHLVYNPLGADLPGPQKVLEAAYKDELKRRFGIVFNDLYTITNMPIARFATALRRENRWDEYMSLLAQGFNPQAVEGLMCRDTINVGWQGEVYDCDFNAMLQMQWRDATSGDATPGDTTQSAETQAAKLQIEQARVEGSQAEPAQIGAPQFLWDIDPRAVEGRSIATGAHCFGCTAGAGSSCGGALAPEAKTSAPQMAKPNPTIALQAAA